MFYCHFRFVCFVDIRFVTFWFVTKSIKMKWFSNQRKQYWSSISSPAKKRNSLIYDSSLNQFNSIFVKFKWKWLIGDCVCIDGSVCLLIFKYDMLLQIIITVISHFYSYNPRRCYIHLFFFFCFPESISNWFLFRI